MNSELAILKFIEQYTKHNPDDNGQKYSQDQANLILTFVYSLIERLHPKVFEDNISETKFRVKTKSKNNDDLVKIPLNHMQILHYKLLYNISYISLVYPDKLTKFNFSEDLIELFDDENKIISTYKEIKDIGLN
jgi:hypothetical protein